MKLSFAAGKECDLQIYEYFSDVCCVTKENYYFPLFRFTAFVTKYNLMSKDNLIVPIMEGEGATESEA